MKSINYDILVPIFYGINIHVIFLSCSSVVDLDLYGRYVGSWYDGSECASFLALPYSDNLAWWQCHTVRYIPTVPVPYRTRIFTHTHFAENQRILNYFVLVVQWADEPAATSLPQPHQPQPGHRRQHHASPCRYRKIKD